MRVLLVAHHASGVIDLVYEAAAAAEAWPPALTAIADALNASTVSVTIIDESAAVSLVFVAPRNDPFGGGHI